MFMTQGCLPWVYHPSMPQMSPISWVTVFVMTLCMILLWVGYNSLKLFQAPGLCETVPSLPTWPW